MQNRKNLSYFCNIGGEKQIKPKIYDEEVEDLLIKFQEYEEEIYTGKMRRKNIKFIFYLLIFINILFTF